MYIYKNKARAESMPLLLMARCCFFILFALMSLFFSSRICAQNLLVVGNSISHHSPLPDRGWDGDWGMAASSADRDYVHQLVTKIEENNQESIELFLASGRDIERDFFETRSWSLQGVRGEFDYIVVQLGDNIRLIASNKKFSKNAMQI